MPQIKIKGMKVEEICKISSEMIDELENLLKCPRDYFTIECINSIFIKDGSVTESYPFVEVGWFDRGQVVQDSTAKIISKFINGAGYKNVDIIFTTFKENDYYENGQHF